MDFCTIFKIKDGNQKIIVTYVSEQMELINIAK